MSRRSPAERDDPLPRVAAAVRAGLGASAGQRVASSAPSTTGRVAAQIRAARPSGIAPIYLEAIVQSGPAIVASNVMPPGIRVPAPCTLNAVYVNVGTAPTGSALTVLVKRGGSTLATVTVAAGSTSGSVTGLGVPLAAGNLLTVDVSAIGSTVAGSDVLVSIEAR
jgi:hypothetical protein